MSTEFELSKSVIGKFHAAERDAEDAWHAYELAQQDGYPPEQLDALARLASKLDDARIKAWSEMQDYGYMQEAECGCVLPDQSCSACRSAARHGSEW